MADRKSISTLTEANLAIRPAEFGRTETEDQMARHGHYVIYRAGEGKNSYLGSVAPDDLFDADGNRFYQD